MLTYDTRANHAARPYKGKSVLAAFDDYTVVDIETTGLSPQYSSIIELGALKIRGGKQVEERSILVDPGFPIPEGIAALTGITDDMVRTAPTIVDALPAFLDFVDRDVIVGHNVHFDVNFLYDKAAALGMNPVANDFVDTMRLSRFLYPYYRHHTLADLVERLGVPQDTAHRALADCYATAACYEIMKRAL